MKKANVVMPVSGPERDSTEVETRPASPPQTSSSTRIESVSTKSKIVKKSKEVDDKGMSFIEGRGVKELGVSNVQSAARKALASFMTRIHKVEIAVHFSQVTSSISHISIPWPKEWSQLSQIFDPVSLNFKVSERAKANHIII